MNKWIYIGYAAAWIATSAAVITGIVVTKSLIPMWAMLIPVTLSIKTKQD